MRSLFVVIAVLALTACGRIETGMVGVRTNFNKQVETAEMNPGFYTAFLTHVDEYTVKEIEVKFDNLTPKGRDNLSLADFDVSIWYQPLASQIAEMYIKYSGMSPCEHGICYPAYNLVARVAQGAIFDAVSQYESLTIHTKRGDLETRIKAMVQEELDKGDKGVFAITKVVVRQIKTDPNLEASIQAAVRMQKQTEAKELEVQLAKAEARRVIAEAQGQAQANKIIADSLTEQYLRYKQIEVTGSFAGGEGTHTVLLPSGGAVPLVNVSR